MASKNVDFWMSWAASERPWPPKVAKGSEGKGEEGMTSERRGKRVAKGGRGTFWATQGLEEEVYLTLKGGNPLRWAVLGAIWVHLRVLGPI